MAKADQAGEKETEFHEDDEVLVLVDNTEQQLPDVVRGRNGLKTLKSFYLGRTDAYQKARREDVSPQQTLCVPGGKLDARRVLVSTFPRELNSIMQGEAAELLAEDRCEGMEYEDFRTDLNEAIQDALTGAVQEVTMAVPHTNSSNTPCVLQACTSALPPQSQGRTSKHNLPCPYPR